MTGVQTCALPIFDNYLSNVERQAENLFEQIVKSLAEQERVTKKTQSRKYDVVGTKDE